MCPYMCPYACRLQNKLPWPAAAPQTEMVEEKEQENRVTLNEEEEEEEKEEEEEEEKWRLVVKKEGRKGGVRQNAVLLREVCVGESGDGERRRTCSRGGTRGELERMR